MIVLPDYFSDVLKTSPVLEAGVLKSLDLFEPWLEQSGMPFFPGFTDHSPRHIHDVLTTSASLISDGSRERLGAEDITVLCMSILLHDCGMHMTQDAFRALVGQERDALIQGFEDVPWARLWKDFLSEASRFGQQKLIDIFGEPEPVRVSEIDLDNLTEKDCLLIGEFVRRHHTRLAHEIAVAGVSTKKGGPLTLVGLEEDFRDISGLVARSHGRSIRSTFKYIKSKYGLIPEYRRIKIPYLMSVLRISDYIQVKSERAIASLLSVKELKSPISKQEWLAHFSVKDVSTRHDDPEAIYVQVSPPNAKTFLKFDFLFKDIQRELDESWATLGEVYGRHADLASLGLSIRRVRSNIDDKREFAKSVKYVPVRARFDTSGPDLLRLLVGPLYDYKYSIGIRELVQNAVDACREKYDLQHVEAGTDFDVQVEIHESEDGTGWVIVRDSGVGMTLQTVTEYFLIAGASFRNSDVWKRLHTEESGDIRVLRGGRFGVGILAAFLLGDDIEIRTRHIGNSESEGLEFKARIDDDAIEIRRCIAPCGTSIQVWISNPDVLDSLRPHANQDQKKSQELGRLAQWDAVDWFIQSAPSIRYSWQGYSRRRTTYEGAPKRVLFNAEFFPDPKFLVPLLGARAGKWRELPDPAPYKGILWTYANESYGKKNDRSRRDYVTEEVSVNGIRVENLNLYGSRSRYIELSEDSKIHSGPRFRVVRPSMAIFDPAAVCPINLQRSAVAFERMGVDERLGVEVVRDYLKSCLKHKCSSDDLEKVREFCRSFEYWPGVECYGQVSPVAIGLNGFFLCTPAAFSELAISAVFFVDSGASLDSHSIKSVLRDREALVFRRERVGSQDDMAWFRGLFAGTEADDWYSRNVDLPMLKRDKICGVIPAGRWSIASQKGKVARFIMRSLSDTRLGKSHVLVRAGRLDDKEDLVERVKRIHEMLGEKAEVVAWELSATQPLATEQPLILESWKKM